MNNKELQLIELKKENEKLQDEIKNLKEQVRQLKTFGEEQVKLNSKQYQVIKSFQLKQ